MLIAKQRMQDTLSSKITRQEPLTETEKQGLYDLVSKGTRAKTRDLLRSLIWWKPITCWPNPGRFTRVHLENGEVSYCAGQSYPDEIRDLRNLILGRV